MNNIDKDKALINKTTKLNEPKDKLKPIMINKKPIQLKQGGFKNKNMNIGMDSDDENDYPFDDGLKCIIF